MEEGDSLAEKDNSDEPEEGSHSHLKREDMSLEVVNSL